jgi:hypothetical protein
LIVAAFVVAVAIEWPPKNDIVLASVQLVIAAV